jgi:dTDP-4-dehydrorhamnose reductase
MSKKIVILGNGFVGSNLAQHFEDQGIEHKIFAKKDLDYTNKKELKKYIDIEKDDIECVIISFGYTGVPNVDACEENKNFCWDMNVQYPLEVIALCHQNNIPVIHIGSGCIYSGYEKNYTEEDEPDFGMGSEDASYYSRCKHAFETSSSAYNRYIFRIRIPFTDELVPKNYFTKLLKYDTLINESNSVTSIKDFNVFVQKFIDMLGFVPYGVYNVVNTQPIKAQEIVEILEENGLKNTNWKFIETENLNTVAKRSNCILSTDKIKKLGLELPDTIPSIRRDIEILAKKSLDSKEKNDIIST